MMTTATNQDNKYDIVIGTKVPQVLLDLLDKEALDNGVKRSTIMRWALCDRYNLPRSAAL